MRDYEGDPSRPALNVDSLLFLGLGNDCSRLVHSGGAMQGTGTEVIGWLEPLVSSMKEDRQSPKPGPRVKTSQTLMQC